jgi:hypothetical protein
VLAEISEIPFGNAAFHVCSCESQPLEPDRCRRTPAARLTITDNFPVLEFLKFVETAAQFMQGNVMRRLDVP